MQEVRNVVINIFYILLLFGCSSTKSNFTEQNIEEIIILNNIIKENTYYKTIIKDLNKPIDFYVQKHFLQFNLCVNDSLRNNIVLNEEDTIFIKQKFRNQKTLRIDHLNNEIKVKTTKDRIRFKTNYISLPVIFRDGKLAIFYNSSPYGSSFNLLKKIDGKWKIVCSSQVWIE
jgi:hypothetical protein